MEKIIYLLKAGEDLQQPAFCEVVLGVLSEALLKEDTVLSLRVSLSDADVARAEGLKLEHCGPLPDAMVSLWVQSANEHHQLESLMEPYCSRIEGYLVTESEVLAAPSEERQRTPGSMQLCCLEKRADITREEFLTIWKESHGPIAVETQSTFGYRQHIVVRKLTEASLDYTAIVEEHFPAEAMDSPHAFFDAVGDDRKLAKNRNAMVESCARFIDFNRMNCIHLSEYTIKD
ncbi:EthD domain-containing protein [Endozoicomonas arenosclerae]|uniref:EthD domain-containing protein n=1 Tax=Endozoicomonas arenosclerae TaxID=1633495 RepID=UPI000780749D|nr:EthD domain-containing protein [Endozoicomonas arenosclerae]